jgi:tetratricopeptide (TPR) repeat protein
MLPGLLEKGQRSRCLEILADALTVVDAIKQPEEKSRLVAWFAGVYAAAEEVSMAKEQFARAILLARATETAAQKNSALYEIAAEYADSGMKEEAGKVLTELYEVVTGPDNEIDTGCELVNIAGVYVEIEQLEKAEEILKEAERAAASLKDNWFRAERLTGIAETYLDTGNKDEAVRMLEEARRLQRDRRGKRSHLC